MTRKSLKFPRTTPFSKKRETGRPVDWTTADRIGRYYRTNNAEAIKTNEQIECLAPACDANRADRSQYCRRHARRLRDAGDPVCRLPKALELERHRKELERRVNALPEKSQDVFYVALEDAVRQKLLKPEGWAGRYHDIRSNMPVKAKAAIVLANLRKRDVDLKELIIRALVLVAWSKARFNGMPQNRRRFIETQIGKLAIRKAKLMFTQRK